MVSEEKEKDREGHIFFDLSEHGMNRFGRVADQDQPIGAMIEGEGFAYFENFLALVGLIKTSRDSAAPERIPKERVLFLFSNRRGVRMGEGHELVIQDRDEEDTLPLSKIGKGPLNRKLSQEFFHVVCIDMEDDDPGSDLPPESHREPLSFPG